MRPHIDITPMTPHLLGKHRHIYSIKIVYCQFAGMVSCGQMSLFDGGSAKCAALYALWFRGIDN